MTRARSGGGILGKNVSQAKAPKAEPVSHSVSMNRPSEIGLAHHYTVPPIYNKVPYSTPHGPTDNTKDLGPGGCGRVVMRAGTQSANVTRPMPRGRDLFK
jgi:hypothetical protein